jgi:hypothetical protein
MPAKRRGAFYRNVSYLREINHGVLFHYLPEETEEA